MSAKFINVFLITLAAAVILAAVSGLIKISYGSGDEKNKADMVERKREQELLDRNQGSIEKLIDILDRDSKANAYRDSVLISMIKNNNEKILYIREKRDEQLPASDRAIDNYGSDELRREFSKLK